MVSPPLAKNMSTYASTYPSLAGIMVAAAVMAVVSEAVTSEDTVVAMEAVTSLDL